jgi:hypothetical protein
MQEEISRRISKGVARMLAIARKNVNPPKTCKIETMIYK